jgi:hypothetical protein
MTKKQKEQLCPVPGCGKLKKNITEHLRICHPDYKPEEVNSVHVPETPQETPATAGSVGPEVAAESAQSPTPLASESQNKTPAAAVKEVKPPSSMNLKKILLLIGGALLIIIGVYMAIQWQNDTSQYFLGIVGVLLFGGGGGIIYLTFKKGGKNYNRPSLRAGKKKYLGDANSITVYAKPDPSNSAKPIPDRIEFENLDNPPGLRRKLRNNGKYYAVNICDETKRDNKGDLIYQDLILPDNQYCDPRLLKDAVEMRYSREYYTPEPSLFQKIKPVLFIVIVCIGALILVMIGDPPPA